MDLGKHWKLTPVPTKLSDLEKIQMSDLKENVIQKQSEIDVLFWMLRSFFPSVLKVSCCNLGEGQQRYFHQHVESAALQCEFISSVESEYVGGGGEGLSPCVTGLRLLQCRHRYFTETVPSEHAVMSIKSSGAFIFHLANLYIFTFANPMICSDDYAPPRCGGPAETLLSSS